MGTYYTPLEHYREIQFQTADQGKLILAAYDAALRYSKKGLECLQDEDQMGKSRWLIRAYEIVSELHRSLKPVPG
ncbi:MAG: flagellar protein FliS, partial [bacterium]